MMIPLILMSIIGIAAWIKSGQTIHLPFLPGGEAVNFKSLIPALGTGIYVAMWNYMGWELPTAAGDGNTSAPAEAFHLDWSHRAAWSDRSNPLSATP